MPAPFAAVFVVGPRESDTAMLEDTLDSLLHHEPAAHVILVDVADPTRDLADWYAQRFAAARGCTGLGGALFVLAHANPGHGICSDVPTALIQAMHHYEASLRPLGCEFLIKIDPDALVIAPFAERIAHRFAEQPNAGMLGAFDVDPNGRPRDFAAWGRAVLKLLQPVAVYRHGHAVPRVHLHLDGFDHLTGGHGNIVRQLIRDALDHGYTPGEHCQGGAMAFANVFIDRLGDASLLDDPRLFETCELVDDPLFGMLCRAVGLRNVGMAGDGEPFGITYRGLPDSPQRCLDRGFALIHSVKNDPGFSESQVRAFFGQRRLCPPLLSAA